MLAGMGGVSYRRSSRRVSEAGGFGCLGASTMSPEELVDEIRGARARPTSRSASTCSPRCPSAWSAEVEEIIEGGASVFVAGLGVPRDVIELCHETTCWSRTCAARSATPSPRSRPGCDFVVAQGTEAGGHTGTVATMPLVPQIVDAVGDRVPVVAAGGIFDGRGLAAALALGADGVWIGTRFIATPEARAVPGYKDALLRTAEDGTVISRGVHGQDAARGAQRRRPSTARSTPRSCSRSRSR